jgi:hypothetical protein
MTEFFFKVSEKEMHRRLKESQEMMLQAEREIVRRFGVSDNTASAVVYLRTRSRWSVEKELELIEKDRAGNPIALGTVLSGEF